MTKSEQRELKELRDEVTKLYIRVMDFEQARMDVINDEQVRHIVEGCLKHWNLQMSDVQRESRERGFVDRRMLLGYVLMKYSPLNQRQVASLLGYKNHTSTNHIKYAFEDRMFTDPDLRRAYTDLLKVLEL